MNFTVKLVNLSMLPGKRNIYSRFSVGSVNAFVNPFSVNITAQLFLFEQRQSNNYFLLV